MRFCNSTVVTNVQSLFVPVEAIRLAFLLILLFFRSFFSFFYRSIPRSLVTFFFLMELHFLRFLLFTLSFFPCFPSLFYFFFPPLLPPLPVYRPSVSFLIDRRQPLILQPFIHPHSLIPFYSRPHLITILCQLVSFPKTYTFYFPPYRHLSVSPTLI